jgi:hypothetical protein
MTSLTIIHQVSYLNYHFDWRLLPNREFLHDKCIIDDKTTGDISGTGDIVSPADKIPPVETVKITLKNQPLEILEVLEIFYLLLT